MVLNMEVAPPCKCPVCNRDLTDCTDEYRRKHINRCKRTKPKYFYSNAPCGRPRKRQRIKTPSKAEPTSDLCCSDI